MSLALEKFRLIDTSRLIPGPTATWMLADLGMDVIKVEEVVTRPGRARDALSPATDSPEEEVRTMAWNHFGRNKKSLALNLQSAEGREILHRLVKTADVFFGTSLLPAYKKLGADYETLSAINPRLVVCTFSGYGQTGSFANYPGNESSARGLSGLSSLTTMPGGEPLDPGYLVMNMYAASLVVVAIQAALLAREHTGRGQHIDMAQAEAGTVMANIQAAQYLRNGEVPKARPLGLNYLKCKDGKYLTSAAWSQTPFWAKFCESIGRPQYKDVPRKNIPPHVFDPAAEKDIRAVMLEKTQAEWMAIFPTDIPVTPMLELDEALEGPYVKERGILWNLDHPTEGRVRQMGSPLRLSDTPPAFRNFAPLLGEHTVPVMRELGYSEEDMKRLEAAGVIKTRTGG